MFLHTIIMEYKMDKIGFINRYVALEIQNCFCKKYLIFLNENHKLHIGIFIFWNLVNKNLMLDYHKKLGT